jgi:succinate dehydrogenase/fumarate reductase iron-sulfur protein
MSEKRITVMHYIPETGALKPQEYQVPAPEGATVLQALQYIYEELDPHLAYRYGCRYRRCGLCGVMVDGKPRLACKTKLKSVSEIAPLTGMPLLRSLVTDRSAYMERLQGLHLFLQGKRPESLGILHEDPLHKNLMHCVECLCCVASCPECSADNRAFAGPYAYIKLAQLHLDPRDETDRKAQAATLGQAQCTQCMKCVCPNGIKLHDAIKLLKK